MTDAELFRRAEAAGISVTYTDWRKQQVQVPAETLTAILDALDRADRPQATGDQARATGGYPSRTDPDGPLPRTPAERAWGFAVQLYSVRSRLSWGHGDLHDLAELARWSGRSWERTLSS